MSCGARASRWAHWRDITAKLIPPSVLNQMTIAICVWRRFSAGLCLSVTEVPTNGRKCRRVCFSPCVRCRRSSSVDELRLTATGRAFHRVHQQMDFANIYTFRLLLLAWMLRSLYIGVNTTGSSSGLVRRCPNVLGTRCQCPASRT